MTTYTHESKRAARVAATNEWMRRYIEHPERFAREFQAVQEFAAAEAAGKEPSYGEVCEAYLTLGCSLSARETFRPVGASAS